MNICPIVDFKCCCKKNVDTHDNTPVYKLSKDKKIKKRHLRGHQTQNKQTTQKQLTINEPISLSMDSSTESLSESPIHTKISISTDHLEIKKYKINYNEFYTCDYIYNNDNDTINLKNKTIIFDHYRQDGHKLPIKGWLHRCLHCATITGNSTYYGMYNESNIYIQLCGNCIYRYRKTNNKLTKSLHIDIQNVIEDMDYKTFYI
jgi:hypothetical protein